MNIKWDLKKLQDEALKYSRKTDFQNNSSSAYVTARRRGVITEICSHMRTDTKKGHNNPKYRWSNEDLFLEASKYTSRADFRNMSYAAYVACKRRKILDNVCVHMNYKYIYWNVEMLKIEALKYKYRAEFESKNVKAYSAALRLGMDNICSHMPKRSGISVMELELLEYIIKHYPNAHKKIFRNIKIPRRPYIKRFEIDIYIPELNKGIEFDGRYWHSLKIMLKSKSNWPSLAVKNYNKIKDDFFKSQNISLLHIKEENWRKNKEKVKEICDTFLNIGDVNG